MNELVQAVITVNKERQAQARQLNLRAGQKLFTVLSREEMFTWVSERIAGAQSIREISNPANLRLQAFDQNLVDTVVRENPESITLLGRQVVVEYREGCQPKVTLKLETGNDTSWRQLPNDGVKLVGGRMIEVNISFGWYDSVSGTDIPKLKEQMRERLNRKLWEAWQKPVVTLPDLASVQVVIPNIITVPYGTCVVEGTPLVAYGVAAVKYSRYYSSDPWFEGKWYQNKTEAEAAHANSVSKLGEIRAEIRNQQELLNVKAQAQAAQIKVGSMYDQHYYNTELSRDLKDRLYNRRYAHLPSSLDELRQWTVETNALFAEVETFFVEGIRRKQEEEADLARAVATGEIFVGFEAWHRRGGMTSNGDGWVIKADGTLRERDSDDVRRHKSDGNHRWERVRADELALRWSCGHIGDVAGNSTFEVAKAPKQGCTPEQLAAVKRIEEEIGAPAGSFGLDPEATKQAEQRLASIRTAATKALGTIPNFSYLQVAGQNGVVIEGSTNRFRVNHAAPFTERCDARDAQVVHKVAVAEGMLEFLAYDKYGQMNFAFRWRPLREEESVTKSPEQIEGGKFTDVGNRWFKCPSGHTTRVDKSEWTQYQQGETISLSCSLCGSNGTIKR
jgi:hypothetical protein